MNEHLTPFVLLVIVVLTIIVAFFYGYVQGRDSAEKRAKKGKVLSRASLGGQISEQVAPFVDGWPQDLQPSEARFIGKPVDFIVFKGMDNNEIDEVVFVEVKTGKSRLSTRERQLQNVIEQKRVRWETCHPKIAEDGWAEQQKY